MQPLMPQTNRQTRERPGSTSTPATPCGRTRSATADRRPVIARGWVHVSTEDGYVVALQVGDRTLDGWQGRAGDALATAEDAMARCATMGGCGMFPAADRAPAVVASKYG